MTEVFEGIEYFLTFPLDWLDIHEEENRKETNSDIISNCFGYTYVSLGP